MRVPVNPEEIDITLAGENSTHDVMGTGEIVVPRKPKLREASWSSFLPEYSDETFVENHINPENFVSAIKNAMENKTVGRLIISRSGLFDTNFRCIITEFETQDKGGEPGDIYYTINLKEYKDYQPKRITILTTPNSAPGTVQATLKPERPVETPTLRVGATVTANGRYWYTSAGAKPFGTANNLQTKVTRIVNGAKYPVHIGSYGWVASDQLQITG